MGKPTSTPPSPQSLRGAVPLCAPPQHRLAVYYLIAACASLAERLCNRKGLSRISATRSFLLHNKVGKPTSAPMPLNLEGRRLTLRAAATPLCGEIPHCGVCILPGGLLLHRERNFLCNKNSRELVFSAVFSYPKFL